MKNFNFLGSYRGVLSISVMLYHSSCKEYNRLMHSVYFGVIGINSNNYYNLRIDQSINII